MTYVFGLLALIFVVVGALIGTVGIGGMFIVPSLTYIGDMDIHVAIATAMAGYIGSGTAGVIAYSMRGSIAWRQGLIICAGAVPGAFIGAATVVHVPGLVVELIVAGLTLYSGLHSLCSANSAAPARRRLNPLLLLTVGLVVGFGSALSGTGGPLILLPILMWLRVPILIALGAAHMSQIPISLCATASNLLYGTIDATVAIVLAVLLGIGVAGGVALAHKLPTEKLRGAVAIALVLTGALLFTIILSR